jgi:tetraacyldisaccharide 4'-kinase
MRSRSASRWVAGKLEEGALRAPPARWASRVWAALADPVRPVALPSGAFVIGVGGAVLGGSGKSPVCAALAAALASAGLRVAVVASGYRALTRSARRVSPRDSAREVGDEALAFCRELGASGVSVFSGPCRSETLALANLAKPDVILVDGLLQARPRPLGVSILVLDGLAPWGTECCPPAGDLRARRARLLSAADVLLVQGELRGANFGKPAYAWSSRLTGARTPESRLFSVSELGALRLGLVLALARPERVERALAQGGVTPRRVRLCGDHARPRPGLRLLAQSLREERLDAWLTTPKCATKLGRTFAGAPLWVLEQRAVLPAALLEICAAKARTEWQSSAGISGRRPW